MKSYKWHLAVVGIAVVVAAVGSSALTSITIERSIIGKVLGDADKNAAVQIKDLTGNSSFLDKDSNGKYTFDLNDAINKSGVQNETNTTNGFNPDALFYIGNATKGAFEIQNNSDLPVTLSLTNAAKAVTLHPQTGDATVAAGESKAFYFVVDTTNFADGDALNGTLQIQGE